MCGDGSLVQNYVGALIVGGVRQPLVHHGWFIAVSDLLLFFQQICVHVYRCYYG